MRFFLRRARKQSCGQFFYVRRKHLERICYIKKANACLLPSSNSLKVIPVRQLLRRKIAQKLTQVVRSLMKRKTLMSASLEQVSLRPPDHNPIISQNVLCSDFFLMIQEAKERMTESELICDNYKSAGSSGVLRLRGGADEHCQIWTILRKKRGEKVIKECLAREVVTCEKCDLSFCAFCMDNHVCDSENLSIEYNDIMSDPRILVQWMFNRFNACLKYLKQYHIISGSKCEWECDHDLADIFKVSVSNGHYGFENDFTTHILRYWGQLKERIGEKFTQYLVDNCKVEFRPKGVIIMRHDSNFSDSARQRVCELIESELSLHIIIPKKDVPRKKGNCQESCCRICKSSEASDVSSETLPPSPVDKTRMEQNFDESDEHDTEEDAGIEEEIVATLGQSGKQFSLYSKKTRNKIERRVKKAIIDGNVAINDIFSRTCHHSLVEDAVASAFSKDYNRTNDSSQNAFEGIIISTLSTYFSQREKKFPRTPPHENYRTLSIVVASKLTLAQTNDVWKKIRPNDINKITKWQWRNARAYHNLYGPGAFRPCPKSRRNAFYKKDDLDFMIQHLYSKESFQSVAFGTHDVKMSNGEVVTLPSLLRLYPHKELYQSYKLKCEVNGKIPVKRTIFDVTVNIASKQDDKALSALDSVCDKCGAQNFKAWRMLVQKVCINNMTLRDRLLKDIAETEEFLRHDFKNHLNEDLDQIEKICDHSMSYAFDAKPSPCDTELLEQKEREFTRTCKKCQSAQLLVESTRWAINNLLPNDQNDEKKCRVCVQSLHHIGLHNETRKTLHGYLDKREDQLLTLLTHLIRSKHESEAFEKIINELQDDVVFLITDFKMKLLSMFYRESQAAFFGKRGISWLGFLLLRRKTAAEKAENPDSVTDYVIDYYDLISDDAKEDGEHVINSVACTLKNYATRPCNSHIKKCIAGADGAGCFSGSDVFVAFASMGLWTGIRIVMHFVSEAGQGKTRVDNHFAWSMKSLWNAIISGKGSRDVYDAASACNALSVHVLPRTTIALTDIVRSKQTFHCKAISGLNRNAQRIYHYGSDDLCTHVTLHPQSFLPEGSRMTSIEMMNTLTVPATTLGAVCPSSNMAVVNAIGQATICEKNLKEFTANKKEIETKRDKKKEKKSKETSDKTERDRTEESRLKKEIEDRGFFPCPQFNCTQICRSYKQLERHVEKEEHTSSTSLVLSHPSRVMKDAGEFHGPETLADILTKKCLTESATYSRLASDILAKPVLPSIDKSINVSMLEGYCNPPVHVDIHDRVAGFAQKSSSKRFSITSKMLAFVIFCFKQGVLSADNEIPKKLSPERACELQLLLGTAEGALKFPGNVYWNANENGSPTFVLDELLEIGQMKAYFGYKLSELEKTLRSHEVRELAAANAGNLIVQVANSDSNKISLKLPGYWKGLASKESDIPNLCTLAECTVPILKLKLDSLKVSYKTNISKTDAILLVHKNSQDFADTDPPTGEISDHTYSDEMDDAIEVSNSSWFILPEEEDTNTVDFAEIFNAMDSPVIILDDDESLDYNDLDFELDHDENYALTD